MCKKSKLELEVINKFSDVITQQKFDWLKYKKSMSLDFYIPDKNIAIECQGKQHFTPDSKFGEKNEFDNIIQRDILKYNLCKEHNIEIIYYFPKEFLKYDIEFYKDKKCFHNINDMNIYIIKS